MTCSVYTTVTVALDRYFELSGILKNHPWVKNGKVQCLIVLIFSVLFNFTRWFELEYHMGYDIQNSTTTEVGINVSTLTLKVLGLTIGVKVRNMKMDFNTGGTFIRLSCLVALYNNM